MSEGKKCSSSSVCHLVLTESCCDLVHRSARLLWQSLKVKRPLSITLFGKTHSLMAQWGGSLVMKSTFWIQTNTRWQTTEEEQLSKGHPIITRWLRRLNFWKVLFFTSQSPCCDTSVSTSIGYQIPCLNLVTDSSEFENCSSSPVSHLVLQFFNSVTLLWHCFFTHQPPCGSTMFWKFRKVKSALLHQSATLLWQICLVTLFWKFQKVKSALLHHSAT